METKQLNNGKVEIWTDAEHVIRKKGDNNPTQIRRRRVNADELGDWEEVAIADMRPYSDEEYNAKVAELIHQRYDADKETSLINNMLEDSPTEEHVAEYREYQAFRAECKRLAKDPELYKSSEVSAPEESVEEAPEVVEDIDDVTEAVGG